MNHIMKKTQQTAIITGGADGLGFALAKILASKGIHLALFDFNETKLELAKAALSQSASVCRVFCLDVTDIQSVQDAVQAVIDEFGGVEILVNCAGITGKTNMKSHEVDLADFERVMRVNVLGCLNTSRTVLPGMLGRNYGRILHIASIAGKEGNAGMVAYSASKAAVIGMAKVQGKEYAETGITVNALAPAVIRTEMVEKMPPEQVDYMTQKIPAKRCGTLEEFAEMAAFIVSPENSFCTGFCFDLSGGRATY